MLMVSQLTNPVSSHRLLSLLEVAFVFQQWVARSDRLRLSTYLRQCTIQILTLKKKKKVSQVLYRGILFLEYIASPHHKIWKQTLG
jgi:hypothetical protein